MEYVFILFRDYLSAILVFFIVLFTVKLFNLSMKMASLPPGPWGVPLFGFLPFLSKKPIYCIFEDLAQKYGSVFRIYFGTIPIVVVSSPDLIRKTFRRGEFSGKPQTFITDMVEGYGVANASGGRWKNERMNVHARLRALGMTAVGSIMEKMEAKIMIESENLVRNLATMKGGAIQASEFFNNSSANVLCSLLMSERFPLENKMLRRLTELSHDGFNLYSKAEISCYIPFMSFLPNIRKAVRQLKLNRIESFEIIRTFVDKRRKSFDPMLNEDMIDSFLYEEYMMNKENKEPIKDMDMRLLQVICDLFSSGSETVSTSLNWSFLYLIHNPKVAERIQNELNEVIGRGRLPSLNDRPNLPYTEATISEVLRLANLLPVGSPHSTTTDAMIGNYLIPEGTTVICNIYNCHMDPDLWNSPHTFNPDRFINSKGSYEAPRNFMPFGVGRRMCLGEVLGKSELFLFVSSILHVFHLETSHGELPSLKPVLTTVNSPLPYKIRFISRDDALLDTLEKSDSRQI